MELLKARAVRVLDWERIPLWEWTLAVWMAAVVSSKTLNYKWHSIGNQTKVIVGERCARKNKATVLLIHEQNYMNMNMKLNAKSQKDIDCCEVAHW